VFVFTVCVCVCVCVHAHSHNCTHARTHKRTHAHTPTTGSLFSSLRLSLSPTPIYDSAGCKLRNYKVGASFTQHATHPLRNTQTHTLSLTMMRRGGLAGVLNRFWVVPNPEIGFRPLSIHKSLVSETNLRNQFVSKNLVWNC
jgi:hypothetical protein